VHNFLNAPLDEYFRQQRIQDHQQDQVSKLSNFPLDTLIKTITQLSSLQINDNLPHHIFVILPGEKRSEHIVAFASQYWVDTVATAAQALFEVFKCNHFTRSAAGQLLDSIVCDIFAQGGVWKIHEMEMSQQPGKHNQHWKIWPSSTYVDKYLIVGHPNYPPVLISGRCPPNDVVFQCPTIRTLPPTGTVTLYTGYYTPTSVTEATFDSFYYEADEGQAMVLQFTVSNHHSMKKKGLKWLQDLGVKSVCYVAVTGPQEDFDLPVPNEYSEFLKGKYRLVLEYLT